MRVLRRETGDVSWWPDMSFYRKVLVSFSLIGILPLLYTAYLISNDKLTTASSLMLGAILISICILLGFLLLRHSAEQLHTLARETAVAGRGPEGSVISIQGDEELKDIAENFNHLMEKLTLAKQDLANQGVQLIEYAEDLAQSYRRIDQEEALRNNLCRYISSDLVGWILENNDPNLLSNKRKPITVLFADIRSFTALSEFMEPEEVVSMLNEYFSIMVDIVFRHNGMLDKLVGDQLMAVFGQISNENQGANEAVYAAMEMQEAVWSLMEKRKQENKAVFKVGIGINTGNAIFAHVGSENRMDYTVIGDTVNAASRLEQFAKGGEVLIGKQTKDHLNGDISFGERFELEVKNRAKPVACYRIEKSGVREPMA